MLREIGLVGGAAKEVQLTRHRHGADVILDGKTLQATHRQLGDRLAVSVDGISTEVTYAIDRDTVLLHAFGRTWRLIIIDPAERALLAANQSDIARAPMPGVTVEVFVAIGDEVKLGQTLLIIESMKMQMEINSSRAGTVEQVGARPGENFALGAPLVTLVPLEAAEV